MERPNASFTEKTLSPFSGWPMLAALIVLIVASIVLVAPTGGRVLLVTGLPIGLIAGGLYIVQPNVPRVLVLFGRYKGTVRQEGFWYTNPFTVRHRVSVKAHNLNGDRLKVNDLAGNPIEIAAVVVWKVADTARAMFDVEDYEHFVSIQSEAAVRTLASTHPYDEGQSSDVGTTLRGSAMEVAAELKEAVQQRLDQAGIHVIEARISHLAYAQEIASAMLQRQQASAIISARQRIVEGAVGMVQDAIEQIARDDIVELDDERKATLVGNLLVVLCSHENPTPVLNTGSLYN